MPYLVGTDEAGFGPNLGPLVIAASVWHVPAGAGPADLYRLLNRCVTARPGKDGWRRVAMADSKELYQSGGGLAGLERGVLAALALLNRRPACWCEAWETLAPGSAAARRAEPWYCAYDLPLPVDGAARACDVECLARGMEAASVRLVELRCRAVFPAEFNAAVAYHGTKGAALSHLTLGLAADVCGACDGPVSIVCDKHGGRNRYGALLAEHFPEWLVEVYGESREASLYRFGPSERRIEVRFRVRAEECLPAALASMAAKYLRELAMRAFNDFWLAHLPALRPTAGYPGDARRFLDEIRPSLAGLGITESLLWRER